MAPCRRMQSRVRSMPASEQRDFTRLATSARRSGSLVLSAPFTALSSISLAEVLATSDVPGGVVNVLTGSPAEIAPWLASHQDVNALDPDGAGDIEWGDVRNAAAEAVKRGR